MRELRRILSDVTSSKARGRLFSNGAERLEQGLRSSRAAPQFAAGLKGDSPLALRGDVETGGPAGAADAGAGAADGGAGGADTFVGRAGALAGGADAAAGAADGVADGGDGAAAGGDGIGARDVGGAVASLDCRKICSLIKELTDDIALSALWRTAAMPSEFPKTCSPMATKPCKA
jgi:hypothetical protein